MSKDQKLDDSLFEDVPYQDTQDLDESMFEDVPFKAEPVSKEVQGKVAVEEAYSSLESGAMGMAQGVSLGFADEIGGAAKATYDVTFGDASMSELSEQYSKHRDYLREEFKEAEENNPKSFMAGDITGGIGTAIIPGLGAAKGLSAVMKVGATAGAISGIGRSEDEDLDDQLIDGLLGGATGAAFAGAGQAVAKGAGKFLGKASKFLDDEAGMELRRALGFTSQTAKKNLERVAGAKGFSSVKALREIADEVDLEGKPIFSSFRSIEDSFEALKGKVDFHGRNIGNIVGQVDDQIGGPSVEPAYVLQRLKKSLGEFTNSDNGKVRTAANDFVKDLISPEAAAQPWTMSRLWAFRKSVDSITNFKSKSGVELNTNAIKRKVRKELENVLRENLESQPASKLSGAFDDYVNSSNKYALLRTTQEAIQDNIIAKEEGFVGALRKAVHLGGIGLGAAAGATTGGMPGMIVGGVLGRAASRGHGAYALQGVLRKAGAVAAKNSSYAHKLSKAAGISAASFERALSMGEALHDFTIEPLARNTEAVKKNFPKINAILEEDNPEVAEKLKEAVENNDEDLIRGLMNGLSMDSKAKNYIQPGLGWDGKAISEGDIVEVEDMIKSAPTSSRQKAILMQQFVSDRKIPTIEEEKPFYKVYDPSLKTSVMK